jgi:trehalose 6-phosphate phosphatase
VTSSGVAPRAVPAPRDARALLAHASADWSLFLDVDGCLVDFEPAPEAVRIPPPLLQTLERLQHALGGALAIVSGRTLDDLDRLFAPLPLACAGQYGFERRSVDGTLHGAPMPDADDVAQLRRRCFALAEQLPGLRIEDKSVSFALHYRETPELAAEVERAAFEIAAELAGRFEVQPGAMVREIKPTLSNKGNAVTLFRRETPFRARLPIFLGDDFADEAAFAVVNAAGGYSVCVGCDRVTRASHALPSPGAARAWLGDFLDAIERRAG